MNEKIAKIVNQQILEKIESENILPWQRPWNTHGLQKNLISGIEYHGFNQFALNFLSNFESCYWLTYKQCSKLGGKVVKGSKGYKIIYWNIIEKEKINENTGEAEIVKIPFLRYYTVFNSEQCENIEIPESENNNTIDFEPIKKCEDIVNNYETCPIIKFNEQKAFYSPSLDFINMPRKESFVSVEEYYSTLFHEIVHSTGEKSRLNRLSDKIIFGDSDYSLEELVAEFGSTYLCAIATIEKHIIDNSAAYIKSWYRQLKNNPTWLITATKKAEHACNYILGKNA